MNAVAKDMRAILQNCNELISLYVVDGMNDSVDGTAYACLCCAPCDIQCLTLIVVNQTEWPLMIAVITYHYLLSRRIQGQSISVPKAIFLVSSIFAIN